MYLRDSGKTQALKNPEKPKMKVLLTHLQDLDDRWKGIMKEDMSTSPPRTLVHNLNVHLGRWIKDPTKVQLVLDSLEEEPDQSEDPENL
jgi:hypothetical protein